MPSKNIDRSRTGRPPRHQPNLAPPLHRRRRRRGRCAGPRPVLPRRMRFRQRQVRRNVGAGAAVRPAARCGSRTGRCTWPTVSSPPSRPRPASPWTTRKTSTTTSSGSPRTRNRCRASRTSAPTWRCRPPSWPCGCTNSAGSTRSAMPAGPTRRICAPICSKPASTPSANSAPRTCPASSAWPTTAPPPAATSRRSTTCGIRRSRAGSACSPTRRTGSECSCSRRAIRRRTPAPRRFRRRSTWSASRTTRARSGASPATTTPMTSPRATSLSRRPIRVTSCSCRPTTRTCSSWCPSRVRRRSSTPWSSRTPRRTRSAAEAWINYVYDRANYAKLVAFVQYVPVLSDMTEELEKVDPAAANNPLINPSKETLDKSKGWAPLYRRADSGIQHLVRRSHRRLTGWQV